LAVKGGFMKVLKYGVIILATYCASSYSESNDRNSIFDLTLKELLEIQVITAASGFEQSVARAPATVTVINNEEWRSQGAYFLSEVLDAVPGLHVGKPLDDYTHHSYSIRGLSGFNSNQIKLLIDGEPFEFMQSGSLFIGLRMPLSSYKRIEIVKGPGSAVYGADAFAGVINLVSYEHNELPAQFSARVGSFNTVDVSMSNDFSIGNSHTQWSFDYSKSDDDKNRIVSADLQSIFDSAFGTSASLTPGPIDEHYEVFTGLIKWQWQNINVDIFTWRNFDLGMGAGVAQALDPNGSSKSYQNQLNIKYNLSHYMAGDLNASFSFKEQQTKNFLYVFPAGTVLPIGASGNVDFSETVGLTEFKDGFIGTPSPGGETLTLRLTHLLNLNKNNLLRWEIGYERQNFSTSERKNFGPSILDGTQTVVNGELTDVTGTDLIYVEDSKRSFHYMSVQNEWQMTPDKLLSLGVRYDDYSDFGSTTNPRLGLIWQVKEDITFKFFAGSAFRAPDIIQTRNKNNPVRIGNPSLEPETIDTLETGVNLDYMVNKNLMISGSLYSYHAKNLVAYVFDSQSGGEKAENIGEQKGQGGELWLKWKSEKNITLDFSYSFLTAENKDGVDIADIPNNMAYLSVNWLMSDDWRWNISGKWVADRKRLATDTRSKIDDYYLVTSKIEHRGLVKNLTLALSFNNLFDEKAREPSNGVIPDDYPLAGRQVLLEFTYNL